MRQRLKQLGWIVGAILLVVVGVFAWMGRGSGMGVSTAKQSPSSVVQRGNYRQYTYAISDMTGENKKIAQFDPSVPADETVVLGALRSVVKDAYGIVIPEAAQPAVETLGETNFVTFPVEIQKVWFELFRNSTGQVGSVHFWIEAGNWSY